MKVNLILFLLIGIVSCSEYHSEPEMSNSPEKNVLEFQSPKKSTQKAGNKTNLNYRDLCLNPH